MNDHACLFFPSLSLFVRVAAASSGSMLTIPASLPAGHSRLILLWGPAARGP